MNLYANEHELDWDSYAAYRPVYPSVMFDQIYEFASRTGSDGREIAFDFGSGTGTLIPTLLQRYDKVVGSDLNSRQVEIASGNLQKHFEKRRVDMRTGGAGNAVLGVGFGMEYEGKVDLVISAEAVHWFPEVASVFIKDAAMLLKPGGTIAFSLYPPDPTVISHHPKTYEAIKDMFIKNFYPLMQDSQNDPRPCAHTKLDAVDLAPFFGPEKRIKWQLAKATPSVVDTLQQGSRFPDKRQKDCEETNHQPDGVNDTLMKRCNWSLADFKMYLQSIGPFYDTFFKSAEWPTVVKVWEDEAGKEGRLDFGWWFSLVIGTKK